jgi:hypothetical protein
VTKLPASKFGLSQLSKDNIIQDVVLSTRYIFEDSCLVEITSASGFLTEANHNLFPKHVNLIQGLNRCKTEN